MNKKELTEIFSCFESQCRRLCAQNMLPEEKESVEVLISMAEQLLKSSRKTRLNKTANIWIKINRYMSDSLVGGDEFLGEFHKTQRRLRLINFLDSQSRVNSASYLDRVFTQG